MTIGHGYGTPNKLGRVQAMNLGCGYNIKKSDITYDWVNVDSAQEVRPDVTCNIDSQQLPFKDHAFDYVYCCHAIEHFIDITSAIKEMYRVTKPDGLWKITVPYGNSWQDNINHKTMGWHELSWHKYTAQTRTYYSDVKLELLNVTMRAGGFARVLPFKKLLSRFLNNVYGEITYELRVKKEVK